MPYQEVCVRFTGFGSEEDEWINVKKHVRQRSLPCEAAECVVVLPGDLILCFQVLFFLSFTWCRLDRIFGFINGICYSEFLNLLHRKAKNKLFTLMHMFLMFKGGGMMFVDAVAGFLCAMIMTNLRYIFILAFHILR